MPQKQKPGIRLPQDDDLEDEREGLLVQTPLSSRQDGREAADRRSEKGGLTVWQEIIEIFHIAVPTALGNLSEFLPITFAMGMVGQLNVGGAGLELDALAMANSYWNMTGLAVQYGLNSAMRTLSAQAVGSGRSKELSGIHVQRGTIIALVALVPSIVMGLYADKVLVLAGQPADLAALAKDYVLLVQPALAGIALMTILQRILQAEGHILANFYISFFIFLLAPIIQYFLIDYMGYGLHGAGYAFSIYNCLYLVLMVPYMISADLGHVFVLRRETLSGAGMHSHLALAIPGLLCQMLEWASMELVSIVAGTRPSARQLIGALGLCLNLEAIFCMFAVGFMVAVSIKVGHAIGRGDAAHAKRVSVLGIVAAFGCSGVFSVSLYLLRHSVVHAYTADAAIAKTACALFAPLGLLITLQAVNCTTQGVLTGAGLQRYTATCNLFGWYFVAAPMAFGLIWGLDLDLEAGYVLLLSCCAAMFTSVVGMLCVLARHDWQKIIDESFQRLLAEQMAAESADRLGDDTSSRAGSHAASTCPVSLAMLTTGESVQRPRGISLAQSIVSGYSIVSDNYSNHNLGTSPFVLHAPHPGSLTFIVPQLASRGLSSSPPNGSRPHSPPSTTVSSEKSLPVDKP